jgi:outer membrane receptor protein involved in Fe transport
LTYNRSVLIATAAALIVAPARGQNQQQAQQQAQIGGIEEIVVTARKQEERLQEVPLTVTAFSGSMIDEMDINDPYDLSRLAPGFNFQNNAGRRVASRLLMRGLTTSTTGAAKASAFIDGVYVFGDFSFIDFGMVERIEVIPGPQSTQFGRSTFAGAFNFITRLPSDEITARVQGSLGTLGTSELHARVGGPLMGDKILGQIGVYHNEIEGPKYWVNSPDGVSIAGTKSQSIYPTLVFNASDDLQFIVRSSYNHDDDEPSGTYLIDLSERNFAFTRPDGVIARYYVGPLRYPSYGTKDGQPYFFNFIGQDNPGLRHDAWRTNAELRWTFGGGHDLKIHGAHNYENEYSQQDGDFTFFPGLNTFAKAVRKDDSVEVRIGSPQDQSLRYAIGAFYLKTQSHLQGRTFVRNVAVLPAGRPNDPPVTVPSTIVTITNTINTVKDKSVFGGLYFDVTDQLTLTAEARYQSEDVTAETILPAVSLRQRNFKAFLPRVNVDYKVNDDVMLYSVFSVGNQPGGFNTSPFIGLPGTGTTEADRIVDEEEIDNYELGIKSTWFDGLVLFNLAAFHMDWKKQQVSRNFFSPTGQLFSVTQNSGTSDINGAEMEAQWVPSEGFELRATGAYYDTSYGPEVCSVNLANLRGRSDLPAPNNCIFVGGNEFEAVSKLSYSLSFGYQWDIVSDWTGYLRGEYAYQSRQYDSEMNLNWTQPANVVNGRIGVERDNLSIELWARNLTNEQTYTRNGRFGDVRAGGDVRNNQNIAIVPRLPRQVGIRATLDY